ncbi:MAG: right-handed parallel beta-helix repeat-containing protein [Saprospiraceae bacterium]|nr:right-handed parallel beta-helix repeat-containing protein [Lewinella sp.]
MNKIIGFCFLFLPFFAVAQEFILNGDFEDGPIPFDFGHIHMADNWTHSCSYEIDQDGNQSTIFSTDLFDSRSSNPGVSIPSSLIATLPERTGDYRYAGFYRGNFSSPFFPKEHNEMLSGKLKAALGSGCYKLSFYAAARVSMPPRSDNNSDKSILDVYLYSDVFCNDKLKIYTTPSAVNDGSSWTKYEGSFSITPGQANLFTRIGFELREYNDLDLTRAVFVDEVSLTPTLMADAGPDRHICLGEYVELCANTGSAYAWNTGATTQCITVNPSVSTVYTVSVYDNLGCFSEDQVNVYVDSGTPYTIISYTLSTDQTWSSSLNPFGTQTISIRGEMVVPAGKKLEIKNMKLKFGPYGKVTLEAGDGINPGGQLILDQTTLTINEQDHCENRFWRGVRVEGNSAKTQDVSYQAALILRNNSRIERAVIGVGLFGVDNSGAAIAATSGGIIKATDSWFLNNRNAVRFIAYGQQGNINSVSSFVRCNFFTHASFPSGETPETLVIIEETDGVRFTDNKFAYLSSAPGKNDGISITNATATIDKGLAPSSDGNFFYRLKNGIYVNRQQNISSGQIDIQNNRFWDNESGIWITGTGANYLIRDNAFRSHYWPNNFRGIVSLYASGLDVIRNSFDNMDWGVELGHSSGFFQSNVYGNDFSNCFWSLLTHSNNDNLQVKCNTFRSPNDYTNFHWVNLGSVMLQDQGSCNSPSSPAGNLFEPSASKVNDILSLLPFEYFHHANTGSYPVVPDVKYPGQPALNACVFTFDPLNACDFIVNQAANISHSGAQHPQDVSVINREMIDKGISGLTPLMPQADSLHQRQPAKVRMEAILDKDHIRLSIHFPGKAIRTDRLEVEVLSPKVSQSFSFDLNAEGEQEFKLPLEVEEGLLLVKLFRKKDLILEELLFADQRF